MILEKRGPLAKVWLAAHYERKLTRKEISLTSIPESVNMIRDNNQLRITSQLLIGIVRIYSRKTKYLLDELNEAICVFQTKETDLPCDVQAVAPSLITLQETITLGDYPSRFKNITLEDVIEQPRAQVMEVEDTHVDFGFDQEMPRYEMDIDHFDHNDQMETSEVNQVNDVEMDIHNFDMENVLNEVNCNSPIVFKQIKKRKRPNFDQITGIDAQNYRVLLQDTSALCDQVSKFVSFDSRLFIDLCPALMQLKLSSPKKLKQESEEFNYIEPEPEYYEPQVEEESNLLMILENPTSSNFIFQNKSRHDVALMFYEILLLSSKNLISVSQSQPYGDIQLNKN